jgi:glycosyltransferase involved in cell wall biosynthesis
MEKKTTQTNDVLLSVCLLTYNHEFFIRKAIENAVNQQTNFDYEIIIGEDCSTDNTRKICEEYQEKYPDKIRLLPSEKNLGLKENFLQTFRECKGKYIAYLEGDDYWLSTEKLQKQIDILEKDLDVSMVHTNCKVWDVENNRIYDCWTPTDGVCIREKNIGVVNVIAEFEGNFRQVKTSSCCYRKQILEDILKKDEFAFLNPEFPTQDFQLFLEMSMKGKFAFIPEEMTMIGLHDSLSAAFSEKKQIAYRLGFYKIGIYYIQKYNLPQKARQIWIRKQLNYLLNKAFKNKDKNLAKAVRAKADLVNYQMPITQKLLYLGTCSGLIRLFVYPFWQFLNAK